VRARTVLVVTKVIFPPSRRVMVLFEHEIFGYLSCKWGTKDSPEKANHDCPDYPYDHVACLQERYLTVSNVRHALGSFWTLEGPPLAD
jgi:hypothetical protein